MHVEEIGVFIHSTVITAKFLTLFIQQVDENIRHARSGYMRLLKRFRDDADPGLGMHARRCSQRIPGKGGTGFSTDVEDFELLHFWRRKGKQIAITTFPVHDDEWNLLLQ